MGDNDANKSDMKRWQAQAEVSFLFRVADNFYIGPMASYDYVIGKHIERPELLQGMDQHTWNVGAGVSLVYDNRDNLTNPHRGICLNINQMFRPKFMGNDYASVRRHFVLMPISDWARERFLPRTLGQTSTLVILRGE